MADRLCREQQQLMLCKLAGVQAYADLMRTELGKSW
jgi:hypothetical protein